MTADSIAIDSSLALEQLGIDALELISESELGMMGLADLRSQAITAAESALATVKSTPGRGNAELHAARIEYAIADLLRRESPTPEALTRAIALYDRVLQREDMGQFVLFMTVGRAFAAMQLGVVGDGAALLAAAQTAQSILCGKDPLAIGRRSTWAATLGREFLQHGALDLAIPVLESAISFAQKDTRPIYDRARMTRDAEKQPAEFPTLIMADEAMREHQAESVFGPFEGFYELKGLFPTLEKFMSAAERRRTIFIEDALDPRGAGRTVASAIVTAADRSKGTNGWFSYQWTIAPEDEATLRSTLYLRPGDFQE